MAYPVNNIIPFSLILTPQGLTAADFNTAFAFATQDDLQVGVTFENDTYRDYASTDEVLADFLETSPVYLMARRWFSVLPSPPQISVYMWNDDPTTGDSVVEVAGKAVDAAWRYHVFFPNSVYQTEADVVALADWCDANIHMTSFTTSAAGVLDPQDDTDTASVLLSRGNRRIFVGYRKPETVTADASQAYANVSTAAVFQKFNPNGLRTAITAEYQVLTGIVGESLSTTAYNALESKSVVFWTQIELQGSVDASRVVNSKTPSSFVEFIDDVYNLDVFRNALQVAGYNYIANAGTKRALTEIGYAGLRSEWERIGKQYYDNGVLGRAEYVDPVTGETELAKYGFVLLGDESDVLDLTPSERTTRKYPPTQMLAILARAGHVADLTVTVQ